MIRTEGFGIADGVSDGDLLARTALESPAGSAAGVRNLMEKSAAARELAASDAVAGLARAVLGAEAHVVRAILFDKTPEANWKVPWHQDVTIAVSAQANVPGYGPWSVKDGVVHVRPPSTVLERILVVRVHLDDCGPENGPVRVLPRSHTQGLLSDGEIAAFKQQHESVECVARRGEMLAFFPLLLHASSPATVPTHRRVAHFEFANVELPRPLMWAMPR